MNPAEALHEALLDNYERAGRETGYWGNYFLRDLRSKGGLATAKALLRPSRNEAIAPGLQALIDAGRTDLSVESTVLQARFRELFSEVELAEANRRLNSLPDFTRRRATDPEANFPDEVSDEAEFAEGTLKLVKVNVHERNRAARKACIAKHGRRCKVCDMSFLERYGPIGKGFIHIHHKKPLANRRGEYQLNPTIDLAPVCPNCHAMLHSQNPPLGIDELRAIIKEHAGN